MGQELNEILIQFLWLSALVYQGYFLDFFTISSQLSSRNIVISLLFYFVIATVIFFFWQQDQLLNSTLVAFSSQTLVCGIFDPLVYGKGFVKSSH